MSEAVDALRQAASADPHRGVAPDAIVERAIGLFKAGELAAAVSLCRAVQAMAQAKSADLDLCLWVASSAQAFDLAAELAERLLLMEPMNASRHRQFSASLDQLGLTDRALEQALRACELAPNNAEFALHAGIMLKVANRLEQAIGYMLRAVRLDPTFVDGYHHLAHSSGELGRLDLAAQLAVRAYDLDHGSPERAMFAAHLMGQLSRWTDAIDILRHATTISAANPFLHRTLSHFLAQSGEINMALAEVDHALLLDDTRPEFHLHRSWLLTGQGRFEEAAQAVERALKLDPDSLAAKRHKVTVYLESGNFETALLTSADLLKAAPDNEEYATCMMHVLSQRSDAAPVISDVLVAKRDAVPRAPRPAPTLREAAATQMRVIGALVLRELRTRFGDSRVGYLWALAEPVIHIGALAVVFKLTMHGTPPLGTSFFFFYFTGLVPYHMFLHTVAPVSRALEANRSLLQIPIVTNVDTMISRALLELFAETVIMILFICAFVCAGVDAVPSNIVQAYGYLLMVWMIALGTGMINAVIYSFTHAWDPVWQVIIRTLYFGSGIFYVPTMMPEQVRALLAWNPLLHCVDGFRTEFFPEYKPEWLDPTYPLYYGLAALLLGFVLERVFREKLQHPA